jgi:transcriptional regulator with XRE-family HTH domain
VQVIEREGLTLELINSFSHTPNVLSVSFHVGDVARKLREARGWTQEDLARKARLNKAAVVRFERQNYQRGYDSAIFDQIAHALDTTAAEILSILSVGSPVLAGHTVASPSTPSGGVDGTTARLLEEQEIAHRRELDTIRGVVLQLLELLGRTNAPKTATTAREKPARRQRHRAAD